ncbi:unnamed protein product [Brassicogethes aeneus]|uniref:Corticotropin-releasing factor-binding protein n=1 Tax=Brassicogethes aeneus TaxID=1431903 RepID=A0A9P0B8N6_BRAAE|nr:unnamed protein product [Brassicogethes aeneus]
MTLISLIAVLCAIFCLTLSVVVIQGLPKPEEEALRPAFSQLFQGANLKRPTLIQGNGFEGRSKRTAEFHIPESECIYMTSEEGEYYHKAISPTESACGAYIVAEPDQLIEIRFNYLDVPCDNGGLVAVVDGWELNGEFFPTFDDNRIKPRETTICGQRKIKTRFLSSQNAALIQYRMPARGTSFSFSVKFYKNPTPCNVMVQDVEQVFTMRNYGRRSNCSLSTLFPAFVKVEGINVGVTPSIGRGVEMETGTIHKVRFQCQKRGLDDYVQIGGSMGLDSRKLEQADSLCGLNSKPVHHGELIACGTTTIRLVSSGAFDNSVTVKIRQIDEEDIANGYMSVVCELDEMN